MSPKLTQLKTLVSETQVEFQWLLKAYLPSLDKSPHSGCLAKARLRLLLDFRATNSTFPSALSRQRGSNLDISPISASTSRSRRGCNLTIATHEQAIARLNQNLSPLVRSCGGSNRGIVIQGESARKQLNAPPYASSFTASGNDGSVKFMDVLNRTIYNKIERMKTDKNMTLALLDYHQGQLSLTGQHEEMVIVRASGEVECIDTMDLGFPIGLDAEIADFIGQEKVRLDSQNVAVLYTDGITEAEDIDGVQYRLEKLCEVVKAHCHLSAAEIKDAVIQNVRSHIGKQKVFDDITLLVLKQR